MQEYKVQNVANSTYGPCLLYDGLTIYKSDEKAMPPHHDECFCTATPIAGNEPLPIEGEIKTQRCDACWVERPRTSRWVYFNFRHLKPTWVCEICYPKWKEHMEKLQLARL